MIDNGGYFHSQVIIPVSAHTRNENTAQLREDSVSMCFFKTKRKIFFKKDFIYTNQYAIAVTDCQTPTNKICHQTEAFEKVRQI